MICIHWIMRKRKDDDGHQGISSTILGENPQKTYFRHPLSAKLVWWAKTPATARCAASLRLALILMLIFTTRLNSQQHNTFSAQVNTTPWSRGWSALRGGWSTLTRCTTWTPWCTRTPPRPWPPSPTSGWAWGSWWPGTAAAPTPSSRESILHCKFWLICFVPVTLTY